MPAQFVLLFIQVEEALTMAANNTAKVSLPQQEKECRNSNKKMMEM